MASYIVMEPAEDRRGDAALFVKDAFRPLAVALPVLWLIWNRLWFEAIMAAIATALLLGLATWFGHPDWAGFGSLLIGLYVALEGNMLRIAALARHGYVEEAVIDASTLSEAEDRYYFRREALPVAAKPASQSFSRPASHAGLFALPGAHG